MTEDLLIIEDVRRLIAELDNPETTMSEDQLTTTFFLLLAAAGLLAWLTQWPPPGKPRC